MRVYPTAPCRRTCSDPLGKKVLDSIPRRTSRVSSPVAARRFQNYGVQASGSENTHKGDVKGATTWTKDVFRPLELPRQEYLPDSPIPGLADCGSWKPGAQFNTTIISAPTGRERSRLRMINSSEFGYTRTYATSNRRPPTNRAPPFRVQGDTGVQCETGESG